MNATESRFRRLLVCALALPLAGCAGVARSSPTTTQDISIQLDQTSVTLTEGSQQQFKATVTGATNASLTWSVDGVAGGNSTVGTVSSTGLYTAPAQPGAHTVSVAITSNSSEQASANINVFELAITPAGPVVAPGATQQFSVQIQGISNTSVTWSVDGVAGGNSTTGTITSSGLYTAPNAIGSHNISVTSVAYPSSTAMSHITVANATATGTAVLTYHNDDARDGAYMQELTLAPSNVNSNQFGKLASYPVDGQIYGQPLYMPQLKINGGTHDVVFVATQNNTMYAFDADATSATVTTFWQRNFGVPKTVYDDGGPWPAVGILSTPVIDATTNIMYFVSEQPGTGALFQLHAIDVTTGADKMSPVAVTGSYNGDTLETGCYQRMGLALNPVTNWIYIAFGSCDNGFVFAYDKSSLAQKAVFESTNGAQGGGFWASGGAPAIDDSTGNVYLMSGTDWDDQWISAPPTYTMTGYNDAFLNLNASTFDVQSYFSPDNNYALSASDADLGSGSPILLPGNSQHSTEIIGGGKDGNVYILDPNNMGGFAATNNVIQSVHTGTKQYDNIFSTPAYWNGFLYYHPANDVLHAFSWSAGAGDGQQMSSNPVASGSAYFGDAGHGATVSVSANGNSNGIVWEIDSSAYVGNNPQSSGAAILHAYDATNVAHELYNSSQAGSRDQAGQAIKFAVPTIANGRVYVPTANELDIYGLLGQ